MRDVFNELCRSGDIGGENSFVVQAVLYVNYAQWLYDSLLIS